MSDLAKKLIAEEKQNRTGRLDLGRCDLTDLEAQIPELFELTWLEELILSNKWWDWEKKEYMISQNEGPENILFTIPPGFSQLTQLRLLAISGYIKDRWGINDIRVLEKLTNLTSLDLSDNQISDISVLGKIPGLTSLFLRGNQISDICILEKLPGLTLLDLNENQISDISVLEKIPGLTSLSLRNNQISDISVLEKLPRLTELDISRNQISDISILEKLPHLTSLNISDNQISDISVLEKLPLLTELNLSLNQISDISVLEKLPLLTELNLSLNQISNINILGKLSYLNSLALRGNQINDIIFLEKLPHLTELDLGENQISDISVLEKLPLLTELDLIDNQISDISVLEKLPYLTELNIGFNDINNINILEKLPYLTMLNLSSNEISNIEALEKLIYLDYLHLGWNQISDISILGKLPYLNLLVLSENQISDISVLENLPLLTSLDLSENQISDISVLENLPLLTSLELRRNQIADISVLGKLLHLTEIDLSENQISDISVLEKLPHLIELDLSWNQISDISVLEKLPQLTSLDIGWNQIGDIRVLEKLPQLASLDICSNGIKDISILEKLPFLTSLSLGWNEISNINILEKLIHLNTLDLSSNNISDYSVLEKLSNLTSLYLRENKIIDISILVKLPLLTSLHLNHNLIQEIDILVKLQFLTQLDLADNQISSVSSVKKMPQLRDLNLRNNSVKDIPRGLLSAHNCLPNLKAWWAETEDPSQTEPNRHIKLMLVGNGNAGKSTLFYALKDGKCDMEMDSTHGVLLETWHCEEAPPVSFVTWDFGGQEIYHGTHRLFMESEAVQLIVIDPEAEKDARDNIAKPDRITGEAVRDQPLAYWIETTQQNSPNSALIVVQNKKDLYAERYNEAYVTSAKVNLEYYQVSARRGDGIPLLRAALHEKARELLDYGMPMPRSWLAVRQYFLDNLQKPAEERERLISKAEFFRRCKEDFGVMEMAIPSLLTLLHYNGIIYYSDNYLKDTIIADQRWALDAIYKPLDRKSDFYDSLRNDTYGKTRVKNLFRAFGAAYSDKDKWLFLHFMRSCGLCFPMKESHGSEKETEDTYYVFPEFLPGEMSDTARLLWENKPRRLHYFRHKYEYLNYSRIQSFIVKLGQKTRMENIWRNGILIPTHEGDFLVYADYSENAVVISIEENALHKWLPEILKTWEGNDSSEQWEGWETSTDRIDYQPANLKVYDRRDVSFEKQEQRVQEKTFEERLPDVAQIRPFRLVASYAKEDRWIVEALKKHLSGLRQEHKVDFWYDQKRDGRRDWDEEIQAHFEEADGYVVFVSPDYVDDEVKKYIHECEIPIMIRRKQEAQIPAYCITVITVDYGPKLGRLDYFNDKKAIPRDEAEQGDFLHKFVEVVVKGKFLKPAGE